MDNLAHTLAGAALGQAGLKRRTGLGMATLMIAANLPDLDAIGLLFGENLAWRRGWTHGPVGLVLLPPVLAWIMVRFDRWQERRGRRPPDRLPVRFGPVLALAYVGILSHPLLDFLNTYGVRCLMPFSDRWFYGDALFIIDLLVWLSLGLGIWLGYRRERRGEGRAGWPAAVALAFVAAYSTGMGAASGMAERYVARHMEARGMGMPEKVLASPVPVDPFRRRILFSTGEAYGFGELRWRPDPLLTLEPELVPVGMDDPAVARAAARDGKVADFLYWSRFPFARIERSAGKARVTIGDARYNRRPGEGPFTVRATVPD